MKPRPSRFRRLDDALADLPLEEPMLLTELDGFLTGVLVSPDPVLPAIWMQSIWGTDDGGMPPFEDPLDVQWFADAVMARRDEIARGLARGRLQPIFDTDPRNGDTIWEGWIDGFAEAMELHPEGWATVAVEGGEAIARLTMLIAVALGESELDSVAINALQDDAPGDIAAAVLALHAARAAPPVAASPARVGRNDPCACGSGKKSKRCCG